MKDSILVEYPAELLYPSSQKQELFICTLVSLDIKYSYTVTELEYPIFIIILIIIQVSYRCVVKVKSTVKPN